MFAFAKTATPQSLRDNFPEGPYCAIPNSEGTSAAPLSFPVISNDPERPHYDMPSQADGLRELNRRSEERFFNFKDEKIIPYYMSRADNEVAVIAISSGLKPDHPLSEQYLRECNEHGISVIWVNLPNSVRDPISMREYEDILMFFFTDPQSPLYKHFDPEKISFFLQTHSSSGPPLTKFLTSPETKDRFKHFKAGIMESAFFDNINGQGLKHTVSKMVFNVVAYKNWNKLSYETLEGLLYLNNQFARKKLAHYNPLPNATLLEKIGLEAALKLHILATSIRSRINIKNNIYIPKNYLNERGSPTYGQMYKASHHNRAIAEKVMTTPGVKSIIPLLFVAGTKDDFSALTAIENVAASLGEKFLQVTGEHNPLSESEVARKAAIATMKEYEPDIQKQKTSLTPEGLPEVNDAIDISEGYLSRILRVGRNLTQGGLRLIGRQPYAAAESAPDNAPHAF